MVLELHEQWRSLNFGRLLTERAAFISMDAQNSILDPSGVLSHEGIWKGARDDDGSLSNIIRLAASARKVGMPFFWLRYDRFIGEKQSSTELDRVQYNYWNENYAGDASRKEWECDLVSDVKAILHRLGSMADSTFGANLDPVGLPHGLVRGDGGSTRARAWADTRCHWRRLRHDAATPQPDSRTDQ
jgi:Isochorismatase family